MSADNTRATPPTGEQAGVSDVVCQRMTATLEAWKLDHCSCETVGHTCEPHAMIGWTESLHSRIAQLERDRDSLQQSLDASRDLVNELTNERDTIRESLAAARAQATEDADRAWSMSLVAATGGNMDTILAVTKGLAELRLRAASEGGRT